MRNIIIVVAMYLICVWPAIAGCGSSDRKYYPKENILSHYIYDVGANVEPNIPNTSLTAAIFNLPSWVKVVDANYVTATQVAARCGILINQMKIIIPPDCNAVPVTSLGDPNKFVFKRVSFEVNAPAGSAGTYTGELRVMGENTISTTLTIVVNKSQILFFVGDCNQ
jgi:hypothetical protein